MSYCGCVQCYVHGAWRPTDEKKGTHKTEREKSNIQNETIGIEMYVCRASVRSTKFKLEAIANT